MLRNFLTIAIRNLLRHKVYSAINISGLAIGITCCLLIALYVKDELSFDRYNKNLDRMYRLVHAFTSVRPLQPSDYQVWGSSPPGALLPMEFPEVEKVAQFSSEGSFLFQNGDTRIQQDKVFFADSTVFDIFSWNLIEGNSKSALVAPNSIVLTKTTARRYFGDKSALGQSLIVNNGESYQVTGVVEDIPSTSQLTFNALISTTTWRRDRPDDFKYWGYVDFYTYILVKKDFDKEAFMAKVPAFLKKNAQEARGAGEGYTFDIEPVADAYLRSAAMRQPGPTGSLASLYLFSTIAVFILVIACINFMNLSTARSLDRAKEVGVRKSVGANKKGLVRQFLSESVLLSSIATISAFAIATAVLPAFQVLSGKSFTVADLLTPDMLVSMLAGTLAVGLLAGIYPAFVLSGFKPSLVLKGVYKNSGQGLLLRKTLVVFQFGLSVALIIGSMIVYSQLAFVQHQDKGFATDQMLVIDFGHDQKVSQEINVVKNSLAAVPGVESVSAQRTVPGGFFPKAYTEIESPSGKMEGKGPDLYEVDYDFISTLNIQVVAGRPYSREFVTDSTQAMVVNEAAARDWGYPNPEDIIGKKFSQWGLEGMVIGVVKDFNYRSLHNAVEPLTLRLSPQYGPNSIAVRLKGDNVRATVDKLEKVWKEVVPQRPFLYSFLDEMFNAQYQSDIRFGKLFMVFAGLAIFIACIGLFGLTTYIVEQKTKEIGIRKVLGASVGGLVALLSTDFLKLVLIAIAISTPAALYGMKEWLNGFAYHMTPGMLVIILPGLSVVLVTLTIVGLKATRSAMMNPAKSLRSE